ncbi:hypothetical protein HanIR_Chr00c06g0906031 [Helianthus annuus]|nr:hypothetical protein HanIR_Chr00c06g0906031 [Helianthus annuus]
MDPDSVKSTLQTLAYGNVMAAAARDYQKEPNMDYLCGVNAIRSRWY